MKPWDVIGTARAPGGAELALTRHHSEFVLLADGRPLMSSRSHGSEDALGTIGCRLARALTRPRVLVGGLGMGFTLRAALDVLPPAAQILVAELVPAVVDWNCGPLADLANRPLDDPRVRVETGDVMTTMRSRLGSFDAVLLDVDNGPAAMTAAANACLYDREGIAAARASLRSGGVLAIWSAGDERGFEQRLRAGGFRVVRERVRSRGGKGGRHTLLVAHDDLRATAGRPHGSRTGGAAR